MERKADHERRHGKMLLPSLSPALKPQKNIEFFDPKTGGRHVYSREQHRTDIFTPFLVDIVFGKDGKPGIGDAHALYRWITSQKDYHPRHSHSSRSGE